MAVRPWENYDFKQSYDIQKQKTKWEDYLSGKTQQQRENIKTALIVLTAIVVVGVIAAIIALSLTTMTVIDEPMHTAREVSNAVFIVPTVMGGGVIIGFLAAGNHRYKQPIDKGKDLIQEGLEREEMLKLFSEEGALDMLKEYIYNHKLDYLVYQHQVTPDEAEQMLNIVSEANNSSIATFMKAKMTESATKMWVDLRNKICNRRASVSAEQVVNYAPENYPMLQPVYMDQSQSAVGQWVPVWVQGADGNWCQGYMST